MLTTPRLAGDAEAALDFVKDQQHFMLVANPPQGPQELTPEMVVSALALNGFDDNGRDIRCFLRQHVADLFKRLLFLLDGRGLALAGRQ